MRANGVSNSNSNIPPSEYTIPLNDQYAYTPRKLRVVTIGAGFSGLLMAQKFQHRFPEMQEFVEHTIFERHSQLGGTWLVNTYPGVQCDVPSHIYVRLKTSYSDYRANPCKAFPFDPNPDWSRFYSSGAEIEAYILRMAKKWDLDRDVKLNHAVKEARWLDDRGQWRLSVEHAGQEWHEYADVLLSGQGVLV
jgi:cation diffusion facilitator CzcD-associated flavoprotein CzcO